MQIYDIMGRNVAIPLSGESQAGLNKVSFKPTKKGVYIYKFKSSYGERKGKVVIFKVEEFHLFKIRFYAS